jgi:hypothetical protein
MSKREALKTMMGQAKLMEIIDQAYENAGTCPNCKALSEWWEQHGAELPAPRVTSVSGSGEPDWQRRKAKRK